MLELANTNTDVRTMPFASVTQFRYQPSSSSIQSLACNTFDGFETTWTCKEYPSPRRPSNRTAPWLCRSMFCRYRSTTCCSLSPDANSCKP